jgi:hypothetical protein
MYTDGRCGLARSVRAEQAGRFAGRDQQVNPVHGDVGSETVAEAGAPDGVNGEGGCAAGLGPSRGTASRHGTGPRWGIGPG